MAVQNDGAARAQVIRVNLVDAAGKTASFDVPLSTELTGGFVGGPPRRPSP
jgi:hypothetical protein